MRKYWALIIACAVAFAYHYEYALWLLRLPSGTIIFNDFALLTYQCQAARDFFTQSGTLWGYDPHFAAGLPLSFIWNSNVFLQVLAVAMKSYAVEDVVKIALFCSLMLFPLFFYWTMRNFGFARDHSCAAALAALLAFRLDTGMLFHITGMVTAGIITWYSLFLISLLYRFMKNQDMRSAALLIVFSPLALLIHKTAVVILFAPALALLVQHARVLRPRSWFVLAGAAAASLAANWFWLSPLFKLFKYKTFLAEAPFWQNRDLLRPLKDYFTLSVMTNTVEWPHWWYGAAHTLMLWVLLAGGAAGLLIWKKRGRADLYLPIGIACAFLFVFSYYGAFVRAFAELNPTRYLPVMNLLLAIPASAALLELFRRMNRLTANAFFLAVSLGACLVSFYHLERFEPLLKLRLGAPEMREVTDLVSALRDLPGGGRILLEDSGVMDREGQGQVYALSHLPSQFPRLTGKQFIGGPYPYMFVKHHRVDFHDGKFLGRELEDIPFAQLRDYMDIYDIKWIVSWSRRGRGYFDAYPEYFLRTRDIGRFRIYEVSRPHNAFLIGQGLAAASYNRIVVQNAVAERGKVVLKYHWVDGMRCEPDCRAEPYPVSDDPAGFIQVNEPAASFEILFP
jgi:hypothetical protein